MVTLPLKFNLGFCKMSFRTGVLAACIAIAFVPPVHAQIQEDQKTELSTREVREQVREAIDAIGTYSAQERDKAVEAAKQALAELDADIAARQKELRENWSEMSNDAKASAEENMKALQDARNRLSERYGAIQVGAQNAWEDLKAGFADAYDELSRAWEKTDLDESDF
ncbi:hypothetical protein JM93_03679 [Roseibium hamelinense]|uniref:Uncharacterized protein n=1 Tax=Roseibium hamelinense TaxID=150831 RepID=A0A562SLW3_9HYPH|nr:hypothetical protein [Roseibium hamelinense]MTI45065.1 hypothetical protein [Roseibium hamelinense]TWI82329.1 hypothetical protein JM93_03679 [Roseibium hamelinense]